MKEIQCPECSFVFSVSDDCCAGLCRKCGKPFITETALSLRRKACEEAQAKESGFVINDGVLVRCCLSSKDIVIPDGVISVGDGVFAGNTGLVSVFLPEGIKYIGESTFEGCTGLESIILPERLRRIGNAAFRGCSSLRTVHIPSGVNSVPRAAVGKKAFADCKGLISISVSSSINSLQEGVFDGCCEEAVFSWEHLTDCPACCDVVMRRTQSGLCPYCGGEISGLFRRKCTVCGEGI